MLTLHMQMKRRSPVKFVESRGDLVLCITLEVEAHVSGTTLRGLARYAFINQNSRGSGLALGPPLVASKSCLAREPSSVLLLMHTVSLRGEERVTIQRVTIQRVAIQRVTIQCVKIQCLTI